MSLGKDFPRYDFGDGAVASAKGVVESPVEKSQSLLTSAATAAKGPSDVQVAKTPMSLMIRPAARDRWLSSLVSLYTPSYTENICRGAMAGNLLSQWLMFDLMEQTWPRLVKNFNELKNAVIDLEWNLQPFALKGQKPKPEAQRRAQVIEALIWNMEPNVKANENDFEGTIYDVLDSLGKSIAVLEMDIPPAPVPMDLGNGVESVFPVRATRWVHPRYYGYPNYPVVGDELMLNAREVRLSNPDAELATGPESVSDLWVPFPENKFIVSVIKQKSGHPINSGLLRLLGFWWAASNFTWDWFLNFAQIFGVPIRWANYEPNASQDTINLIENLLQTMGSSAYAAFPAGTDLKIIEAVKGGQDNPQKMLLDTADMICDIVILGQTLTTSQGSRGSQSLGSIHKDVRDEKIHAVARTAAKILNQQMIKPLCRLNFGDTSLCPYFQPAAVQAKDGVAVANKYKTILSINGVRVSKQQFYDDNDLVVPAEGDDVLEGSSGGGPQQNGNSGGNANDGDDLDEGPVTGEAGLRRGHRCGGDGHVARGEGKQEDLISNVLRNLTPVQERWLGGVRPFFEELIAKAQDGSVSDADFVSTLERASAQMPELFDKLQPEHLQTALENAMGSAFANGVATAHLAKRTGRSALPPKEGA